MIQNKNVPISKNGALIDSTKPKPHFKFQRLRDAERVRFVGSASASAPHRFSHPICSGTSVFYLLYLNLLYFYRWIDFILLIPQIIIGNVKFRNSKLLRPWNIRHCQFLLIDSTLVVCPGKFILICFIFCFFL